MQQRSYDERSEVFLQKNIDAFLVTKDVNITYLTHFPASESWLLVGRKSPFISPISAIFMKPKGLPKGVEVVRYSKSMFDTTFEINQPAEIKAHRF